MSLAWQQEYEYESFADAFCSKGNILYYYQCVDELFSGPPDCENLVFGFTVVEICVEANCDVQCEEVADIIQTAIDSFNEDLGCDLGPAYVHLTGSPTMRPGEDDELLGIILIVFIVIAVVLLLLVTYLLCSKNKNGVQNKIADEQSRPDAVISM